MSTATGLHPQYTRRATVLANIVEANWQVWSRHAARQSPEADAVMIFI